MSVHLHRNLRLGGFSGGGFRPYLAMINLSDISRQAPLFKLIVSSVGSLYGQLYTDINDLRIRMITDQAYAPHALSMLCSQLALKPTLNIQQFPSYLNSPSHSEHIRYQSNFHPQSLLEQCFCISDTQRTDPYDQACADNLNHIFPCNHSFRLLQLNIDDTLVQWRCDKTIEEQDLSLSYAEQVQTYYDMLSIFRPTINYYVPTFQEYSINTAEHCHIVHRLSSKLQGVLWAQLLHESLVIRLLFKLREQSVLESLLHKAIGYARQRRKAKVYLFLPEWQANTLERYLSLGFTDTLHSLCCHSF